MGFCYFCIQMRKWFNSSLSFLAGVFILLILWGIYFLFSLYSFRENLSYSHYSVPENAELVIEADGGSLFQSVLSNTLIEGKGDDLFDKLRELTKKESRPKQYGINWIQPAAYFKTTYKGKPLQGLVVQVINPKEWNKNINTLLGNTSVARHQDLSGIVVQSDELSKEDLYAFIEQLKAERPFKKEHFAKNQFVSVRQKTDKGNVEMSVSVAGNIISVNGIIYHDGSLKSNRLNRLLTPSDFHFSSDIITKELNDTLRTIIGSDLSFSGISMNYRGLTIAEINNQMTPLPDMDAIIGFEKETTIQQLAESIPNALLNEDGKTILIGKRPYFVKQLDEKSIFLGTSQQAEIRENRQPIGLLIIGSLKPLMKVEGNRLIRMAMRMNAQLSLGMDLSEAIESCTIRLDAMSPTSYQLTSSIQFKKDEDAILSLLKILLKRQI